MIRAMIPPSDRRPLRPRAVSLDAGGVLLLPDPGRVRAALLSVLAAAVRTGSRAASGPNPQPRLLADERLLAAHYAGIAAFDRPAASPPVRTARYRAAYARALGFRGTALAAATAALAECFAEPGLWSMPAPGARAVVRLLARRGVPVVVVSNTEHGDAAALLARAGIWAEPRPVASGSASSGAGTPPVVDSTLVGVAKPDPAIFRIALETLGVGPEELVHVGDSAAADVAGAVAAGVGAFHLDPLDRCPDRGHPHLAGLAELLARLEPRPGSKTPSPAPPAGSPPSVSPGRG